jgi:hypothetical protein
MRRTRHKLVPSIRRRALEIIAAHPDGCTAAMLAAHDIPADVLIERVRSGLATARIERCWAFQNQIRRTGHSPSARA